MNNLPNQNSNNLYVDRIIVEKHYIPTSLYREMYQNQHEAQHQFQHQSQHQSQNIPFQPNNLFRNNSFNSTAFQPPSQFQQPPSQFNQTPSQFNQTPSQFNQTPSQFQQPPTFQPPPVYIPPFYIPPIISDRVFSNFRNNIFGDFINRNIPFNVQLYSTNDNFHNNTELPVGIPLSNINAITTVSRFCDFTQSNLCDSCTICHAPFVNTDICRLLKNCNHIFHLECIETWLSDHVTCPYCRNDLLINNEVLVNSTTETSENNNIVVDNVEVDNGEDYYYEQDDVNNNEEYNETNYDETNYDEDGSEYDEMPELISCPLENIFIYEPQVYVETFTNQTANAPFASNTSPTINTEPILNDINNFINMTTPFINSFINSSNSNSNSTIRLNSENINNQINRQINNFVNNNVNPLLQSFRNFNGFNNTQL
jgi:hypothetical protein